MEQFFDRAYQTFVWNEHDQVVIAFDDGVVVRHQHLGVAAFTAHNRSDAGARRPRNVFYPSAYQFGGFGIATGNAFQRFGTALLGGNAEAVKLATGMADLAKAERDAASASTAISP